ncbi:MAG: invasion associated locus B family protein [Rhodospirillales bacterium]|nr:invasion associated locus B family protein [Alphaproteobacteria bacterium]USO03069.1 MAG: invasion associated locus B family protein [Rhodospirillales bacterium]
MSSNVKIIVLVLVVFAFAGGAWFFFPGQKDRMLSDKANGSAQLSSAAGQSSNSAWVRRCIDKRQNQCEAFQSLVLKQNNMRIAEVAVSLPEGVTKDAKMAVVLPLGIVVGKGIALQVDENEALKIPVYSCGQDGCVSHMNLSPDFVKTMRAGKVLKIIFLDAKQKKIKVEMTLKGFSSALF